jgi:DNA-binding GntR family transcriptional regulator
MANKASAQGTTAQDQDIAARIRHMIIDGSLSSGQRLIESDLVTLFDVSRGTVRQALMRLESEGVVERERNRGARVRQISLKEAIQITEARSVLEGLCARKAAELATEAERQRLREIGEQMSQAVADGDVVAYNDLVDDLHTAIREVSHQNAAAELLQRLRYQSVRHQFRVSLLPGRPAIGLREHLQVIDAICSGDADLAEAVMREHLSSVIDALIELSQRM